MEVTRQEQSLLDGAMQKTQRKIEIKKNNPNDVEITIEKRIHLGFWYIHASSIEEACEKAINKYGRTR